MCNSLFPLIILLSSGSLWAESDSSQFNRIRNIADNIHFNPGSGRRLPIFVTAAYNLALEGSE